MAPDSAMNPRFAKAALIALQFLAVTVADAQEPTTLLRSDQRPLAVSVYAPDGGNCQGFALISPGAGGSERGYAYLARGMASRGYLTLVMGHPDSGRSALREHVRGTGLRDGLADLITEPEAYRSRFMDMAAARQWARARCAGTDSILIGHSMGAATVMMEAGARNKLGLQGSDAFNAYVALSPQGAGLIFPEGAWSGLRKPLLMLTGTRDTELGGASWETRTEAFRNMPAGCKWLGVIEGASHMNFAGTRLSSRMEDLTLQTLGAFLEGRRHGDCRLPDKLQGLELRAR